MPKPPRKPPPPPKPAPAPHPRPKPLQGNPKPKPLKSALGAREYAAFLKGSRLSPKQAILAMCFSCTCGYADGKDICQSRSCPLYPHHPYNPGRVKSTRVVSEEAKKAFVRRTAKARNKP